MSLFDYKLTINEEFDIYSNYLKEKLQLKKDSEEYEDLILSVIDYLSNNKNELIEFSFYITLFMESHNKKYLVNVLKLFNSERLKDTEDIEQGKLEQYKNMMNTIENDPLKGPENDVGYNDLMNNF